MRAEDIKQEIVERAHGVSTSKQMLGDTIPGSTVCHHNIMAGETVNFTADGTFVRILFLCSGTATFTVEGKDYTFAEKAHFIGNHVQDITMHADTAVAVLEVRWAVSATDIKEIVEGETQYPYMGLYADATQYRDPFKSEKTISRAIVPQRVVPRFAMGSVETYGDDLIGKHAHPLLDQYFFSFPENNIDLLIDDLVYPMGADTLLYIPLGSDHGVQVLGDQVAHYIWLDFIQDPEAANAYLDEVHKPTGTMRTF